MIEQSNFTRQHVYVFHHPLISSFFYNDPPTTEIYTLSLHDALPICGQHVPAGKYTIFTIPNQDKWTLIISVHRSEEHTSELQSHVNLVCRLLLEKKKKKNRKNLQQTKDIETLFS